MFKQMLKTLFALLVIIETINALTVQFDSYENSTTINERQVIFGCQYFGQDKDETFLNMTIYKGEDDKGKELYVYSVDEIAPKFTPVDGIKAITMLSPGSFSVSQDDMDDKINSKYTCYVATTKTTDTTSFKSTLEVKEVSKELVSIELNVRDGNDKEWSPTTFKKDNIIYVVCNYTFPVKESKLYQMDVYRDDKRFCTIGEVNKDGEAFDQDGLPKAKVSIKDETTFVNVTITDSVEATKGHFRCIMTYKNGAGAVQVPLMTDSVEIEYKNNGFKSILSFTSILVAILVYLKMQ